MQLKKTGTTLSNSFRRYMAYRPMSASVAVAMTFFGQIERAIFTDEFADQQKTEERFGLAWRYFHMYSEWHAQLRKAYGIAHRIQCNIDMPDDQSICLTIGFYGQGKKCPPFYLMKVRWSVPDTSLVSAWTRKLMMP